jgi:hypothetical protein
LHWFHIATQRDATAYFKQMTSTSVTRLLFMLVAGTLGLWLARRAWVAWRERSGLRVIREQAFPAFLRGKMRRLYPALDEQALGDVERGLRQFFVACARSRGGFVAMPSRIVDALWHEFILHTRSYDAFCRRAFGRMLHHTPAQALGPSSPDGDRKAGLRRAWLWSCKEEGIDPQRAGRLPMLFALDAALAIPGGYHYVPDCSLLGADRGNTHCASDITGCGGSCGSGSDSSDGSGSSSDGGGGDGGGGCGGGD